jgi:hemerythrin-like domain-containing protein
MSAVLTHSPDATARAALSEHPLQPFDVLDECHREVVAHLHQMQTLVDHLRAHGHDEPACQMARQIFDFFMTTAREHHQDEERHVFPALLRSGNELLMQQTLRLQQDHGWIEEDWLEMAPQFEAIAAGYNWFNLEQLEQMIPVFHALYRDHIALEETMIYPEAQARISRWDLRGMGREMAQRRRAGMLGKSAS